MNTSAAADIFDRSMTERTRFKYRRLLDAAASMDAFTIDGVAKRADHGAVRWSNAAARLLRCLYMEGHLRKLTPENGAGSRPIVYEWVDR